ncbi:hypothetical protein ASPFODRAFT_213075 [Aspergillus luchuensis CBS 106.47]|uniref:Uncharacterized protein n=1 Tax=Aspergillus luchuensis (strain CBS 106.47) TaxID=1137211 RepID=A0A1M3SZ74_ASPLC|nr:hypothetical protein ASPFODRAFT_213075 [Aspergillus luchuensis CBS 106.47]
MENAVSRVAMVIFDCPSQSSSRSATCRLDNSDTSRQHRICSRDLKLLILLDDQRHNHQATDFEIEGAGSDGSVVGTGPHLQLTDVLAVVTISVDAWTYTDSDRTRLQLGALAHSPSAVLSGHNMSTVAAVAIRPVMVTIGRTPQGILGGSVRGGTTDVPASKAY